MKGAFIFRFNLILKTYSLINTNVAFLKVKVHNTAL